MRTHVWSLGPCSPGYGPPESCKIAVVWDILWQWGDQRILEEAEVSKIVKKFQL